MAAFLYIYMYNENDLHHVQHFIEPHPTQPIQT